MGDDSKLLMRVENLTVSRGSQKVIQDVNIELKAGEIMILNGENGCGKSTLIEAMANILPYEKGTVIHTKPVFGLSLQQNGIHGDELVHERLTYSMMIANGNPSEMDKILTHWNLLHRKEDRFAHLSFGLKRKISVIQGLMPSYCSKDSRLCLLDEPTEGLDKNSVKLFANDLIDLASKGHGFIIATHDPRISEVATKICNIDEKIIEIENVKNTNKVLNKVPTINEKDSNANLAKALWSKNISQRTMLPILKRGLPLIISWLIIAGLISELNYESIPSNLAGGLILLPGFLAALIKPTELQYFHESRCGDWWKAMIYEPIMPRTTFLEIIVIILAPFFTSLLILNGSLPNDIFMLLFCSFSILLVMYANNAIYSLAENMPRENATFIPLLTLILIWPYLISSDIILTQEIENSVNQIILITIIPSIIYLVVPTLSKR